jgi:hypothetical protein
MHSERAEKLFRKARLAVAEIRPADMNDLALMAAAAGTYDEEFLTVGQSEMISYGVALGLVGLVPMPPRRAPQRG